MVCLLAREFLFECSCSILVSMSELSLSLNETNNVLLFKQFQSTREEVVLKDRGETIKRQALAKEKVVAVKDSSVSFDQDSKTDDNGNGNKKKVDALINEGTEAGKNLLDMLMSSD